jgi:prophage antirepressor-like protein
MEIFKNEDFGEIRTMERDGIIWFIGNDIARALGYKDPYDAVRKHVDAEDKLNRQITSAGQKRNMIVINESGLYSLVLSSKLANAKKFKRWVTSEVLPTIRKHGIYATDNVINDILNNPDYGIKLLETLKEERQARLEAEHTNKILMHHKKLYTATEIAKELGLSSAKKLNEMLSQDRIQFKQNGTWILYSNYSDLGYVHIKQEVLDSGKIIYHRKWTQEGRKFLLEKYS